MPEDNSAVVKRLNSLIHLDFDAAGAYEAAIEHLGNNAAARDRMREFKDDHERHTRDLSEWVTRLGGKPPVRGDLKAILTKGKVVMGSLSDTMGVLTAMASNEEQTNRKYDDAVAAISEPPDLVELLQRNRDDERKHQSWIINNLDQLDHQLYAHGIGPNSH